MSKEAGSVLDKIRKCIAQALEIDDDGDIEIDSTLIGDLGAESIDFLDIVFRLEKAFEIKIPRDDLFPEKVLTDPQYVKDGRITPDGLDLLKAKLTKVDFSAFAKEPLVAKLPDLFTVRMIVDYIERRFQPA